ncbi:MAG: PKD repeat protein [Phenylobacterium sp.]|jgi:PKD repeat protein
MISHLKTLTLSTLAMAVSVNTVSANLLDEDHVSCGLDEAHHALYKQDPALRKKVQQYNLKQELANFPLSNQINDAVASQYVIPVVFHIVHANGAENITDQQVQEAIDQLNEDYNGADTKKDQVFDEFKSRYADVGFKFVLARKDPTGNSTDGITRHFSPAEVTQFNNGSDEQMKAKYMWPRDKYLNMYVVRSAGGQSGSAWAFYPIQVDDSHQARDGVISSHWAVGRSGTATPTHHKILTHEIGHWAYLAHSFNNACSTNLAEFIWGDGNFAGYGDYVNDTPATLSASGCNKVWKPCGDSVGVANSQNYMDYGYCSSMFTTGQKTRMVNAMNSPMADRNKLWTTTNLAATGVTGQAVSALFNIEKNVIMPGSSVSFNNVSEASFGSISQWSWSFPGGSPSSYNGQTPPAVTYASTGTYDVTLTVSNGSGDTNTVTKSDYIRVDQNITMRNATETACSGRFFDSGGNHPDADSYGNREDHILTLNPSQFGQVMQVDFASFRLQDSSNCDLDSLKVYNGDSTDAPLLGTYCGLSSPGSVKANNASGALTFAFHSDVKAREIGWQADISCAADQSSGQPVANANGKYLAKGTTAIQFNSTGSIDTNLGGSLVSYHWDFGSGQSSTLANPSYSYPNDGNFIAVLTVTDNDGNTATSQAQVDIFPQNANPVAVPQGPYEAAVNENFYLKADSSYDPDGTVTAILWNFGDGTTSTTSNLWHKYSAAGTYTISLTVTDNTGLTHTATTTAVIGGGGGDPTNALPTANANGPYAVTLGNSITFDSNGSTDTDGSIVSYAWHFGGIGGDNTSGTGATPAHTYTTAGSYTVTLVVTDDKGGTGQSTASVQVNSDSTAASLPDVCATSGGISNGSLTDGVAKCLANQSTIWLSLADINGHNSVSFTTGHGTGHGTGNLDVYYSNSGWPSETNAQAQSVQPANEECIHLTGQSNYWSYLKIVNNTGGASIVMDFDAPGCRTTGGTIPDTNESPTANANGPYASDLSVATNFSSAGSADTDGSIAAYSWDFGDGSSSSQANPSHSYSAIGSYTATLTVTDNDGATGTSTASVAISASTGGVMCGATTRSNGALTDGRTECVSGVDGDRHSYYVYVENDNTTLYATANGGTGESNIYYNAGTWATVANATAATFAPGNNDILEVTANRGYVYFTLDTDTAFDEVSFTVSSTAAVFPGYNSPGNNGVDIGSFSLNGPVGMAAADDPDCALTDTDTSNAALNLYTFENIVDEYAETNFWLRMRGTAVDSSYQIKFCQPAYGSLKLTSRTEVVTGALGHAFSYEYKHFDARQSNTDTGKAIVEVNGEKAVMTLSFPIQVAVVPHPVQPSCNDITLDADFDGIPDCAEQPGKTFYTMPLYEWGARANQLDLFVEVDYMAKHALKDYDGNTVYDDNNNVITDHGTEPKRQTLERVKQVYAERGIHIHMDAGDLFDKASGTDPADFDLGGGQAVPYQEYVHLSNWTDSYNGRSIEVPGMTQVFMPQYFANNPEREKIFYYVLFANSQGGANRGSSGMAPDLLDRYMFVSLGGTGWSLTDDSPENTNRLVNAQASTMVHELGHIFGLSHDGFPDAGAQNFKLNYPSAMNYLFQLQGGPTDKFADIDYDTMVKERYYLNRSPKLDYACTPIIARDHPNNTAWGKLVHGLSSDPADFHIGYSDGLQPKIIETDTSEALLNGGLDLNCDGNMDFTVGSYDVNNDGQIDQLWDHNDWKFLTFFFHYYNYDVKDRYATNNEFLIEPNYHVKWGSSPTDAKYPGAKKPQDEAKLKLKRLKANKLVQHITNPKARAQVVLPELIGVQEQVMPKPFFEQLKKQQRESRAAHRKVLVLKAQQEAEGK